MFYPNESGAWFGILVYDPITTGVNVGDFVEVIGEITEYYGLTEFKK